VKDVGASHDALIYLFERIHFFVQRLKSYTGMPLTNESTELLGKIMAQVVLILGLSTKAMTDKRISELTRPLCFPLADCGSEKILKKLVGKKDVEEALSQLDMLTKEESLMVVVRNLEIAHHVDGVVRDVDVNVNATKVLTEAIDGNVKETKVLTEDINDNVQATKDITEDIDDSVKAAKVLIEDIDGNVKATKVHIEDNAKGIEGVARNVENGRHHFLSRLLIPTLFPLS
jgi:hypothetical protein